MKIVEGRRGRSSKKCEGRIDRFASINNRAFLSTGFIMPEPSSFVGLRHQSLRWIAITLWLGLLAALAWTSYIAALTFSENQIYFNLIAFATEENGTFVARGGPSGERGMTLMSVAIELTISVCMLTAWLRFVMYSRTLILSLAWHEQQDKEITLFSDMLIAEEGATPAEDREKREEPPSDNILQTTPSEVLRFLAYSWVGLLAWNPVLLLIDLLQ